MASIDGSLVTLQRTGTGLEQADTGLGTTSVQFMNDRYVFKRGRYPHATMVDRDACILNTMSGNYVPRVLCSTRGMMLTERVGRPLTVHNIPHDYRVQAEVILAAMASRGVEHHDLFKSDSGSAFMVEFLLDSAGKLSAIDFGTGSINGSVSCNAPPHLFGTRNLGFTQHQDSAILSVLDAMYAANRSLETYRSAGISVQIGVCKLVDVIHLLPLPPAGVDGSHHHDILLDAPFALRQPEVLIHVTNRSALNGVGALHPGHMMPLLVDVQKCVHQCRLRERCRFVSVSSARRACLWFSTVCERARFHRGLISLTEAEIQGVGAVFRWFDDFVTVAVQPLNSSV